MTTAGHVRTVAERDAEERRAALVARLNELSNAFYWCVGSFRDKARGTYVTNSGKPYFIRLKVYRWQQRVTWTLLRVDNDWSYGRRYDTVDKGQLAGADDETVLATAQHAMNMARAYSGKEWPNG